jgi:hypothetical protein
MARHQTRLNVIDDMILSLECSCGHRSQMPVIDLLPLLPDDATVQDVIDRARCRACQCRGTVIYTRIVYDNLRGQS